MTPTDTPNPAELRTLTETLAGPSQPNETYLHRLGRRNRCQAQARELLTEHLPTDTNPDPAPTGWVPLIPDLTDLL